MGKLDQKVALITGGARGIGRQIALTFAKEGADIAVGDLVDTGPVAEEIRALGRQVLTVKSNVSIRKDVQHLIDATVARFSKLDILVNNAGTSRRIPFLEITEQEWDSVLDTNLKGIFLCTQAAAKQMSKQKSGAIINMASIYGMDSITSGLVHYAASKAGVVQLTRFCALELGIYGIRVNAIAPGLVITDLLAAGRSPDQLKKHIEERSRKTALGKVCVPQDIANVALFLASDDSALISGQVMVVDGGPLKTDE